MANFAEMRESSALRVQALLEKGSALIDRHAAGVLAVFAKAPDEWKSCAISSEAVAAILAGVYRAKREKPDADADENFFFHAHLSASAFHHALDWSANGGKHLNNAAAITDAFRAVHEHADKAESFLAH